MRRARLGIAAAAWLACALLAGGCTLALGGDPDGLREADELFAGGDLEGAAASYRAAAVADPPPAGIDRALHHLALLHSLPGTPLHDPERARSLLERLAAEHPQSPYGRAAATALERERERRRLASELAVERARSDALAARLDAAESRAAEAERGGENAQATGGRERAELRRRAGELEAELARCREQVTRLESELSALKAIDLELP
jgi:hypothetical protein